MNTKAAITSQFLAALEMLKTAVSQCPDELWHHPAHKNPFWLVAYHALFYTHLYLQPEESAFVPWAKHRPQLNSMNLLPNSKPYSQAEILDYLAICQQETVAQTDNLDETAASGFDWISLNKLELQLYNLRHLQLHTGELCERLWAEAEIEVGWVGKDPRS